MTLRGLHPFEPDADGDCYRCEFPADETEVHVPRPVPNPTDPYATHEMCSACGCWWDIPWSGDPNARREWCDAWSCKCHSDIFATSIFEEGMRRKGETVIAYVEPRFTSFRDDVA